MQLLQKYFPYKKILAGRNFGDEGLFFLSESLGYNQVQAFSISFQYLVILYLFILMTFVFFMSLMYLIRLLLLYSLMLYWEIQMQWQFFYKLIKNISVFQTVEEVSFAANGITAEGIKAFDGVLQSNIVLKTLDLSGNPIGDEGIKVSTSSLLMSV